MKNTDRELALTELKEARTHIQNVRDIFYAEKYYHPKLRQNHDARMHQISGMFRHLTYLEEYIKSAETDQRKP